ncbi:hypothetical protein HBA55_22325 [Pseudomaricurvus alkylphenolicus]|uniref:hypothetical protein n=1 Tax=Pseudomaricurvus alkylphenolicus TaxID=1306991 RepID=UPI00142276D2|nr:hypothetical protein [Pseudomaricurvus alkylphenolicus]NIB42360.1 hypothetical protein [Pseudomaricurvus alkylphenolicus]
MEKTENSQKQEKSSYGSVVTKFVVILLGVVAMLEIIAMLTLMHQQMNTYEIFVGRKFSIIDQLLEIF